MCNNNFLETEIQRLNSGRVQTDTVHRRFQKKQNDKNENESNVIKNDNNEEEYYCIECQSKISSKNGIKNLKEHFDTYEHKKFENCIYCSKPAYFYKFNYKVEVYHSC